MQTPNADERVLGIDLGTTYFKVGLFDGQGQLCGLGREPTPIRSSTGGRCEVAPDDFWRALSDALQEALAQAETTPAQVRGLSYSSQANSFLLLDARDRPLTPLILWPDARTDAVAPELVSLRARPDYTAHTGLGASGSPRAALNKALVWRNEKPERRSPAWSFLTLSDYLIFGLTGLRVGDAGTASLLGMEEVPACAWWPEALAALGIDDAQLSRLLRPGSPAGPTTDAAACMGLPRGIPVTVGSLDHHMAALGAGLGGGVADVSESTGTVMACLHRMDRFLPRAECFTGPDVVPGLFFQLAADSNGGAVIEEYRRRFCPDLPLETLSREAGDVAPGSEGLRALPGAHRYPGREGFRGIRPGHGRGHEIRALFESTSLSLCRLVERVCEHAPERGILSTGGGTRSPSWMQIKADLLGVPFHIPACQEAGSRGAAMMAAVGAGWFSSVAAAGSAWRPTFRTVHPKSEVHAFYRAWRGEGREGAGVGDS